MILPLALPISVVLFSTAVAAAFLVISTVVPTSDVPLSTTAAATFLVVSTVACTELATVSTQKKDYLKKKESLLPHSCGAFIIKLLPLSPQLHVQTLFFVISLI